MPHPTIYRLRFAKNIRMAPKRSTSLRFAKAFVRHQIGAYPDCFSRVMITFDKSQRKQSDGPRVAILTIYILRIEKALIEQQIEAHPKGFSRV